MEKALGTGMSTSPASLHAAPAASFTGQRDGNGIELAPLHAISSPSPPQSRSNQVQVANSRRPAVKPARSCIPRLAPLNDALLQTGKQIRGGPLSFCLGCCSIFLVVTVSGLVSTLIARAPLIFLREAENSNGQIDLILQVDSGTRTSALNYSRYASSLLAAPPAQATAFSFHAPRIRFGGAVAWREEQCSGGGGGAVVSRYVWEEGEGVNATYVDCGAYSCFPIQCGVYTGVTDLTLLLVDSRKEARMGVGRAWPFADIPPGTVILPSLLAQRLGSPPVGSTLRLNVAVGALMASFGPYPAADTSGWSQISQAHLTIPLLVTVHAISDGMKGKGPSADAATTIFMEYGSASGAIAAALHPALQLLRPPNADPPDWYQYASEILANLPPATRIDSYSNSNYDRLRASIADFGSSMLYLAGYTETAADTPILSTLEPRRLITLYLGLVLDVLLIILFALSVILVYSLLLVNAESRTFELAVRRMLGSRRSGIVLLLLVQAASYGIPAWITGLIAAQVVATGILRSFATLSSIPVPLGLTTQAILSGTALALAIPFVSSIGPIRGALKRTIRDALDADRPKAIAIKFSLQRSNDGTISLPAVIVGATLAIFGFALYYLLPLALLSFNLSLFFNLFLAIIIGMLAGLILLSLNIELLILRLVASTFVGWWEKPAIWGILWSNLSAGHRRRNRKTVIMYALSIAFIVFITVAATAQIQSATYTAQTRQGSPLTVGNVDATRPVDPAALAAVEGAVRAGVARGDIDASAWSTVQFDTAMQWLAGAEGSTSGGAGGVYVTDTSLRNAGRTQRSSLSLHAVAPAFYGTSADVLHPLAEVRVGATYSDFLAVEDGPSLGEADVSLSQLLYTAGGSAGLLAGNNMKYRISLTAGRAAVMQSTARVGYQSDSSSATSASTSPLAILSAFSSSPMYSRSSMRALAMIAGSPGFIFTRGPSGADTSLTSLPTLLQLLDGHSGYPEAAGLPRVPSQAIMSVWQQQARGLRQLTGLWSPLNTSLTSLLDGNASGWEQLRSQVEAAQHVWGGNHDAASGAVESNVEAWYLALLLEDTLSSGSSGGGILSGGSSRVDGHASVDALRSALSIDDLPLYKLFLSLPERGDTAHFKAAKAEINAAIAGVAAARSLSGVLTGLPQVLFESAETWSVADISDTSDDLETTVVLLELFFAVLALVAMVLCFFSLLASMVTNIHEQRREIGVLLAIGLKSYDLVRVYVHEAFILVLASSLLGVGVGCIIAWTFGQQQSLFTSIPVPFTVPWGVLIIIILGSVICSIFAACVPATRLTKKPITSLLKGT